MSPASMLFKPSLSSSTASSLKSGIADLTFPEASSVLIPKSSKACNVSVLPSLAKIVLNALPITAPPRWVLS